MDTHEVTVEHVFTVPAMGDSPGPALRMAIRELGGMIRSAWMEFAASHESDGGLSDSLNQQQALQYPYLGDPMTVAVVSALVQANVLEEGAEGFHLPERWKGRWKTTKDGRRYAIIPFRHRTPIREGGGQTGDRGRNAMPSQIYSLAAQLQTGDRLVGFGDQYKQSKSYDYYRAAGIDVPAALGSSYTWATSPYEGMIHATPRKTPGGGYQSLGYTTFRTMMEDSPGWYMPPKPGYHLAAQALESIAGEGQQLLDAAAAVDAAAALADATKELFDE